MRRAVMEHRAGLPASRVKPEAACGAQTKSGFIAPGWAPNGWGFQGEARPLMQACPVLLVGGFAAYDSFRTDRRQGGDHVNRGLSENMHRRCASL